MYDGFLHTGTYEDVEQAIRARMAVDFDLYSNPYYNGMDNNKGRPLPPRSDEAAADTKHWASKLLEKGLSVDNVSFIYHTLNPDPAERWSARDILYSGYLDLDED